MPAGDDVAKAANICFGVGAINLIFGFIAFAGSDDVGSMRLAQLVVGPALIGLGVGVKKEITICAWVAAILYGMLLVLSIKNGVIGIGTIFRIMMLIALFKGAGSLMDIKQREAAMANPSPPPRFTGPAPARPAPPPSASPAKRGSDRMPAAAPGPKMRCPNCQKTYPMGTATCAACKVATFQD
jgi:hypothetical protein